MSLEELADSLRLAVGRLARRLRQHSLGGLTPSQHSVLATLDRHGPLTMGGLADMEAISGPSATGIVSRLVDQGLIDRGSTPDDARRSMVDLMDEAKRVLQRGRDERTAYLALRFDVLTEDEMAVLMEVPRILARLVSEE